MKKKQEMDYISKLKEKSLTYKEVCDLILSGPEVDKLEWIKVVNKIIASSSPDQDILFSNLATFIQRKLKQFKSSISSQYNLTPSQSTKLDKFYQGLQKKLVQSSSNSLMTLTCAALSFLIDIHILCCTDDNLETPLAIKDKICNLTEFSPRLPLEAFIHCQTLTLKKKAKTFISILRLVLKSARSILSKPRDFLKAAILVKTVLTIVKKEHRNLHSALRTEFLSLLQGLPPKYRLWADRVGMSFIPDEDTTLKEFIFKLEVSSALTFLYSEENPSTQAQRSQNHSRNHSADKETIVNRQEIPKSKNTLNDEPRNLFKEAEESLKIQEKLKSALKKSKSTTKEGQDIKKKVTNKDPQDKDGAIPDLKMRETPETLSHGLTDTGVTEDAVLKKSSVLKLKAPKDVYQGARKTAQSGESGNKLQDLPEEANKAEQSEGTKTKSSKKMLNKIEPTNERSLETEVVKRPVSNTCKKNPNQSSQAMEPIHGETHDTLDHNHNDLTDATKGVHKRQMGMRNSKAKALATLKAELTEESKKMTTDVSSQSKKRENDCDPPAMGSGCPKRRKTKPSPTIDAKEKGKNSISKSKAIDSSKISSDIFSTQPSADEDLRKGGWKIVSLLENPENWTFSSSHLSKKKKEATSSKTQVDLQVKVGTAVEDKGSAKSKSMPLSNTEEVQNGKRDSRKRKRKIVLTEDKGIQTEPIFFVENNFTQTDFDSFEEKSMKKLTKKFKKDANRVEPPSKRRKSDKTAPEFHTDNIFNDDEQISSLSTQWKKWKEEAPAPKNSQAFQINKKPTSPQKDTAKCKYCNCTIAPSNSATKSEQNEVPIPTILEQAYAKKASENDDNPKLQLNSRPAKTQSHSVLEAPLQQTSKPSNENKRRRRLRKKEAARRAAALLKEEASIATTLPPPAKSLHPTKEAKQLSNIFTEKSSSPKKDVHTDTTVKVSEATSKENTENTNEPLTPLGNASVDDDDDDDLVILEENLVANESESQNSRPILNENSNAMAEKNSCVILQENPNVNKEHSDESEEDIAILLDTIRKDVKNGDPLKGVEGWLNIETIKLEHPKAPEETADPYPGMTYSSNTAIINMYALKKDPPTIRPKQTAVIEETKKVKLQNLFPSHRISKRAKRRNKLKKLNEAKLGDVQRQQGLDEEVVNSEAANILNHSQSCDISKESETFAESSEKSPNGSLVADAGVQVPKTFDGISQEICTDGYIDKSNESDCNFSIPQKDTSNLDDPFSQSNKLTEFPKLDKDVLLRQSPSIESSEELSHDHDPQVSTAVHLHDCPQEGSTSSNKEQAVASSSDTMNVEQFEIVHLEEAGEKEKFTELADQQEAQPLGLVLVATPSEVEIFEGETSESVPLKKADVTPVKEKDSADGGSESSLAVDDNLTHPKEPFASVTNEEISPCDIDSLNEEVTEAPEEILTATPRKDEAHSDKEILAATPEVIPSEKAFNVYSGTGDVIQGEEVSAATHDEAPKEVDSPTKELLPSKLVGKPDEEINSHEEVSATSDDVAEISPNKETKIPDMEEIEIISSAEESCQSLGSDGASTLGIEANPPKECNVATPDKEIDSQDVEIVVSPSKTFAGSWLTNGHGIHDEHSISTPKDDLKEHSLVGPERTELEDQSVSKTKNDCFKEQQTINAENLNGLEECLEHTNGGIDLHEQSLKTPEQKEAREESLTSPDAEMIVVSKSSTTSTTQNAQSLENGLTANSCKENGHKEQSAVLLKDKECKAPEEHLICSPAKENEKVIQIPFGLDKGDSSESPVKENSPVALSPQKAVETPEKSEQAQHISSPILNSSNRKTFRLDQKVCDDGIENLCKFPDIVGEICEREESPVSEKSVGVAQSSSSEESVEVIDDSDSSLSSGEEEDVDIEALDDGNVISSPSPLLQNNPMDTIDIIDKSSEENKIESFSSDKNDNSGDSIGMAKDKSENEGEGFDDDADESLPKDEAQVDTSSHSDTALKSDSFEQIGEEIEVVSLDSTDSTLKVPSKDIETKTKSLQGAEEEETKDISGHSSAQELKPHPRSKTKTCYLSPHKVGKEVISSEFIISPEISDEENELLHKSLERNLNCHLKHKEEKPHEWERCDKSPKRVLHEEQAEIPVIEGRPGKSGREIPKRISALKDCSCPSSPLLFSISSSEEAESGDSKDSNYASHTNRGSKTSPELSTIRSSQRKVSNRSPCDGVLDAKVCENKASMNKKKNLPPTESDSSPDSNKGVNSGRAVSEVCPKLCKTTSAVSLPSIAEDEGLTKRVTRKTRYSLRLQQMEASEDKDVSSGPKNKRKSISLLTSETPSSSPSRNLRPRRNSGCYTPQRSRRLSGSSDAGVEDAKKTSLPTVEEELVSGEKRHRKKLDI